MTSTPPSSEEPEAIKAQDALQTPVPVAAATPPSSSLVLNYGSSEAAIVTQALSVIHNPVERLTQGVKDAAPGTLGPLMSDLRSMLSAGERYAAAPVVPGSRGALGKDLVLAAAAHVQALVFASASQLSPPTSINKRKRAWAPARPRLLGSAEDTVEARRSQMFRQMLEREIRSANDMLVDTIVEIDEASTSEAALFGKDGCVLSLAYIGFKVLLSPLLVLVPQDYPASSPDIWDDPLVQYQSHHLAVAARGHFKRHVMAAPPPLSIQAIATAWDDSVRCALLEAVVPNGGCLATALGSWQSCPQAAT
eukprot:SM000083S22741  [mRNA]  locus=s83:211136:212706:+ [translate_table: standard]